MGTRGPSVQSLGIGMERKTIGAAGPGPELTFVVRQSQKDFATAFCDGHGPKTEGESPLQALLEGIGSICNCMSVKKIATSGMYP